MVVTTSQIVWYPEMQKNGICYDNIADKRNFMESQIQFNNGIHGDILFAGNDLNDMRHATL